MQSSNFRRSKKRKHKDVPPTMASARAEMTLPSVVRLLLMLAPSFSRVPFAPVDSARSDPARSTSEILLTFSAVSPDACR